MVIYEYLQEAIWDTSQVIVQFLPDSAGHLTQVVVSGTVIPFMKGTTPDVPLSGGTWAIPPTTKPVGTHEQWYLLWHTRTGEVRVALKGETRTFNDGYWALLATGYQANGDPQTAHDVVHVTRHAHWKTFTTHPPHYAFFPNGQVMASHMDGSRRRELVHPPLV